MHLPSDINSCHKLILEQQNQIEQFSKEMEELRELIMSQSVRITELEAQLGQNSRNSHKPPSTDGYRKTVALPKAKGKKTGGQKGHKGRTLQIVATPDVVEELLPTQCECGAVLVKEGAQVLEVRQEFDIPPPKLVVREYRKLGCACGVCGRHNEGVFPSEIKARVQYGIGVQTLVVLLGTVYKVPMKKIRQLFHDVYGYEVNESTIQSATQRCYTRLAASEKSIREKITQSVVAFFDETGIRVAGKLRWLHTACTQLYTHLFTHDKRGKKALMDSASIMPAFTQYAMHDCLSSYFSFTQCSHAVCGAHLLRELTALEEQGRVWAGVFKKFLLDLYEQTQQGKGQLSESEQQKTLSHYNQIWQQGDAEEPPPEVPEKGKRGKAKATKGRNLLIRLQKYQSAVLAFAFHEHVPFTNNEAERALRPAKIKIKVAGCFRTEEGSQWYARILGFVATARKHDRNVFTELRLAFSGQTFLTQ